MAAGFSGNILGGASLQSDADESPACYIYERYYLGAEDPQLAAAVCVDELEKKKKKQQTPPFFQQARLEETCLRPSCTMARCSAVRFHKSSQRLRPDMSIPPLSLRYIAVFISAPLPSYSPCA